MMGEFYNIKTLYKMSKLEVDSDGFQVVKSKYSAKSKHTKLPNKQLHYKKEDIAVDIEISTRRITSAVEDLQTSQYLKEVSKLVSTILKDRHVLEIICLGLGPISSCNISRYQLAFLLCLKDLCKPQRVLVHDPIFYKGECDILKNFSLQVLEENVEGRYNISDVHITLVYLPHCPKQLTNNFLWSNWGRKLQNCIIIGNSFGSLIENTPNRVLLHTVPYIYKIHPYSCENTLINNFKYTDIFNDTSIHCFPKENLENLPVEFWSKGEKPNYDNTEEFITSDMVEKLNI